MSIQKKRVVLFTAPNCHWCTKAKSFFKRYEIRYKSVDISKDSSAKRDCEKRGCRGVPVVMIGSRWICGFDEAKIRQEIGIKG